MMAWIAGVISAIAAMFALGYEKKSSEAAAAKKAEAEAELKSRLLEVSNEAHTMDDHELGSRIRTLIAQYPKK